MSRSLVFATVGFSVGILYSVKTQRDTAKRLARPNPALAALDDGRMCGRWYQVAQISSSWFQRRSRDTVIDVARDPLPTLPGEAEDGGVAAGTAPADGTSVGASAVVVAGSTSAPSGAANGAQESPPVLWLRRQEVLGGRVFRGKRLVTHAELRRPDADHPAKLVYTATTGLTKASTPWQVLAVGYGEEGRRPAGAGCGGGAPLAVDGAGSSAAATATASADAPYEAEADVPRAPPGDTGVPPTGFTYAVVSVGKGRDDVRVLSRSGRLSDGLMAGIEDDLEARGYVRSRLARTQHACLPGDAEPAGSS